MAFWGGSQDITFKFASMPFQETISGENALEKVGWELGEYTEEWGSHLSSECLCAPNLNEKGIPAEFVLKLDLRRTPEWSPCP